VLDRVIEAQAPLGGELQHDGGDEPLGDAADPEAVTSTDRLARRQVGHAGRRVPLVPAPPLERDRAGHTVRDKSVERLFERGWGGSRCVRAP
jgi:hypothetical protein